MSASITKEVIERIKKRIKINENGCWIYEGWDDGKGYRKISVKGKGQYVHRVMFQWFYRRTVKKLQIDHICCERGCCNPLHLQAVSNKTNAKLREKRKRRKESKNE